MPLVVPVLASPHVLPLMLCITKSRELAALAFQFSTTSDSGSGTGSERSRIPSMKL